VNNIYTKLGEECAQNGCGVDLFVFPNNYIDLATIGEVCRVSGGEIYKFNYFSVRIRTNERNIHVRFRLKMMVNDY
jgi:protein transport protein SEC24